MWGGGRLSVFRRPWPDDQVRCQADSFWALERESQDGLQRQGIKFSHQSVLEPLCMCPSQRRVVDSSSHCISLGAVLCILEGASWIWRFTHTVPITICTQNFPDCTRTLHPAQRAHGAAITVSLSQNEALVKYAGAAHEAMMP